jgi:hypothetical protein
MPFLSYYFSRNLYDRFNKTNPSVDDPVESNEKFGDDKNDSENFEDNFPDYRHEYIKEGNDDQINNQSPFINDESPVIHENSFTCVSISDFELNPLTVTKTSFFSPSTNSLPNNDVQFIEETKENSTKTNKPKPKPNPKASILIRAYSEQEKHNSTQP